MIILSSPINLKTSDLDHDLVKMAEILKIFCVITCEYDNFEPYGILSSNLNVC